MSKFRKKLVIIEAIQWTGDNLAEIQTFMQDNLPEYVDIDNSLVIGTLGGAHIASKGDFIICDIAGEYYPCRPNIFEETYESA